MSNFYINRTLDINGKPTPDHTLCQGSGVIVVLAEPGAGKTEFLNFLARRMGVSSMSATFFQHRTLPLHASTLVIDGLDEVARIDETNANAIFAKAQGSGAATVILASRSYTWDEARTSLLQEFFGIKPTIIRLPPFDENEQKQLFEHHYLGESFEAFHKEAERFEITPLLGNPQLLNLFAAGYMEGGRRFSTKDQIYDNAVRRMASEQNESVRQEKRPPIDRIVALAGEVFAKLLLSGASGISMVEVVGDEDYPYLRALNTDNSEELSFILNSRLFRPAAVTDKHDPVHRIVAEYCAAEYLVTQIQDPGNILSLRRCLAVIAPNGVVRDELRGMLGWMTSLGGRKVQETIIDLDPYAVFANGDPTRLLLTSKSRLLRRLEALSEVDPYFRRTDAWRQFSVSGFFTEEIVDDVRKLLQASDQKSHLKPLLLELLEGTQAVSGLADELREILLDQNVTTATKLLVQRNLSAVYEHDHIGNFEKLIFEGSADSLEVASKMVASHGVEFFGRNRVLLLLQSLGKVYPVEDFRRRTFGSRYFIRQLIGHFSAAEIFEFLNEVSRDITCTCEKDDFQCECRVGISKITGLLLDHYFEIAQGPHDPRQIEIWTRPLIFRGSVSAEKSFSVQSLCANAGLRQAIQRLAFENLTTSEAMRKATARFHMSHSGLHMHEEDKHAIVDYAFEENNTLLWGYFFVSHNPWMERKSANPLRSHMRKQAHQSPEFLRVWSRRNKECWIEAREHRPYWRRSKEKLERREEQKKKTHLERLLCNRSQIEAGRNWHWLRIFTEYYLYGSGPFRDLADDPQIMEIAEKALRNCISFIEPSIPSLEQLFGDTGNETMVLCAACLANFRERGTLEGINVELLRVVMIECTVGYRSEAEKEAFGTELERLLFKSEQDAIDFAKRYVEPQLSQSFTAPTRIWSFDYKCIFGQVKGRLALDWLTRYPEMPLSAMEVLFDIAAKHSDRATLNELIVKRCDNMEISSEIALQYRRFWLFRHFFFITPISDALWNEFSSDSKNLLAIEKRINGFRRDDDKSWPILTTQKIYRILDAFVDAWPKVNLPNSWGTDDPEEEVAYRFLCDTAEKIGHDDPVVAIPVCDRLLTDSRFKDYKNQVKSLRANLVRKQALSGFKPPKLHEVIKLLDGGGIASVEDLRAFFVELLGEIQAAIRGSATDRLDVFYSSDGCHVDENTARNRIVEMLEDKFRALNMGVNIEHHMANSNRCDIVVSAVIDQRPVVLVTEVKGQWHRELYTAASAQLVDKYTIYPGAAGQGIYLVLWFGDDEEIAGRKAPSITTPDQLRESIIQTMSADLLGTVDVAVLDLSRSSTRKKKVRVGF